jgi:NitT/TauT family transport system substrate-binding protein
MLRKTFLISVIAILTAACGGSTSTAPSTTTPAQITFLFNYIPNADHAAYYAANSLGYYKAVNLSVTLLKGSGSGAAVQRVDTGQADCGIADTPVIINGIRNGAHLKIVAMEFGHSPDNIWTTKQTGVTKPADLVGKTVGSAPTDSEWLLFPALASSQGFDAARVNHVNLDPAAYYAALANHRVDAIFDFTTSAPQVWQAVGKDNAVSLPYSANGLDLYGLAIMCNAQTVSSRPDVVKRFLDASFRGWEYAIQNTQKAIQIEQQANPDLDIPTFVTQFGLVMQLMCTKSFSQNGLGYIDSATMATTVQTVQKYFTATGTISDPTAIYTNQYLTKHTLPSCGNLT